MKTMTAILFILDNLSYKNQLKKKLTDIKIKRIENLIKTVYDRMNKKTKKDEIFYQNLSKILRRKKPQGQEKQIQEVITEIEKNLLIFLSTGEIKNINIESDDKTVEKLMRAYKIILDSLKTEITEIISEKLTEKDIIQLKKDKGENADIEIARIFSESGKTREEFCNQNFITENRLNKAIAYVLNSNDPKLSEIAEKILVNEQQVEEEILLVEQVMSNYNRFLENISLIEIQSLTRLTISGLLKELRERGSNSYSKMLEMYYEYRKRLRLQPVYFKELRNTKIVINGRELTTEDFDAIEDFITENKYPEQKAIYSSVKQAYLNGTLKSLERETLKSEVLKRYGIKEPIKEKTYK